MGASLFRVESSRLRALRFVKQAASSCVQEGLRRLEVSPRVREKETQLTVWVSVACPLLILRSCRRRAFTLSFTNPKTTVRDALVSLRREMLAAGGSRTRSLALPGTPSCFLGKARLKVKTDASRRSGGWRELRANTLLLDLAETPAPTIAASSQLLLLAPQSAFLGGALAAARKVCPEYVALQRRERPVYVHHDDSYLQERRRHESVFGPASVQPFAE